MSAREEAIRKALDNPPPPLIAVDFDGVIHRYPQDWRERVMRDEPTLTDDVIPGAFEALRLLRNRGFRLIVFTARRPLHKVRAWIAVKAPDLRMDVTGAKPKAAVYIDDRAYRFRTWETVLIDLDDPRRYLDRTSEPERVP